MVGSHLGANGEKCQPGRQRQPWKISNLQEPPRCSSPPRREWRLICVVPRLRATHKPTWRRRQWENEPTGSAAQTTRRPHRAKVTPQAEKRTLLLGGGLLHFKFPFGRATRPPLSRFAASAIPPGRSPDKDRDCHASFVLATGKGPGRQPWGAGRPGLPERVWARLVSLLVSHGRGALRGLIVCCCPPWGFHHLVRMESPRTGRVGMGHKITSARRQGRRADRLAEAGWRGGRWAVAFSRSAKSVSVSVGRGRSPVMAVVDCLSWLLLGLGVTCLGHGLVTCGKAGAHWTGSSRTAD